LARLVASAIGDIAFQLTGEREEEPALRALEELIGREGNRFSRSLFLVKEENGEAAGMILCYYGADASRLNEPIIERLREKGGDPNPRIDREADRTNTTSTPWPWIRATGAGASPSS